VSTAVRHRWKILLALLAVVAFALVVAACGDEGAAGAEESPSGDGAYKADQLILATTTSLKDSGLLDELVLPAFNEAHPDITVKTIAVGSGEAMRMGRDGEADVLLVHSPADEAAFMEEGNGTVRLPVAQNHFVIVGPADDPAEVAGAADAAEAFAAIPESGTPFVSRGDDSGTHKKELSIWEEAGVTPEGDWYISTGQGMGETLQVTTERQGYTLTDLGTFLSMQDSLDLEVLSEESDDLRNIYSVIVVNQIIHPKTNAAAAEMFAQIMVAADMQAQIEDFGTAEFGQPLFTPNAAALGGPDY
jgi:tungstate transport system substrate-binding protein